MKKIFVLVNKNQQICNILDETGKCPEEYKIPLTMFQGRPATRNNIKECYEYTKIYVAAKVGNIEATKMLETIHKLWNR